MAREPASIVEMRRALGERLSTFRQAAELTQVQLGREVICDRTTVAHIEKGRASAAEQFWRMADRMTNANGALLAAFHELEAAKHAHELQSREATLAVVRAKADAWRTSQGHAEQQPDSSDESVRRSQQEWLRVRQAPGARGRELNELAALLYPQSQRALGGHVLTGPGWLLDEPIKLEAVRLMWSDFQPTIPLLGSVDHVLPLTDRGERYAGYSRAVRDLVRPRLLENRLSYRLLGVQVGDGLALTFGTTTFFEVFDVKEALAHEFKAAWLASGGSLPDWSALPLRAAIGDPFDPTRLLMSPGISTLTIRRDRWGAPVRAARARRQKGGRRRRPVQPHARRRVPAVLSGPG